MNDFVGGSTEYRLVIGYVKFTIKDVFVIVCVMNNLFTFVCFGLIWHLVSSLLIICFDFIFLSISFLLVSKILFQYFMVSFTVVRFLLDGRLCEQFIG